MKRTVWIHKPQTFCNIQPTLPRVPHCSSPELPATVASSAYRPPCWGGSWRLWAPASSSPPRQTHLHPPPSTCATKRLTVGDGTGSWWAEGLKDPVFIHTQTLPEGFAVFVGRSVPVLLLKEIISDVLHVLSNRQNFINLEANTGEHHFSPTSFRHDCSHGKLNITEEVWFFSPSLIIWCHTVFFFCWGGKIWSSHWKNLLLIHRLIYWKEVSELT